MSTQTTLINWQGVRAAVVERDFRRCTACRSSIDAMDEFDVDHNVPRGAGGPSRFSNLSTLCRRCHQAKHGDAIAPTVRIQSGGGMTDTEFAWFQHLIKQMIPALAKNTGVWMEPPVFGINDKSSWFVPLGDLRRVDDELTEADVPYQSLRAEEYM